MPGSTVGHPLRDALCESLRSVRFFLNAAFGANIGRSAVCVVVPSRSSDYSTGEDDHTVDRLLTRL